MATTSSSPSTPVLGLDGLHPSTSNGSSNGAPSTATNGTSAAPLPSVDPAVFRSYLLALLPPVLGASIEDLEGTLFDDEFDERVVKYASEGGGSVIYVAKTRHDAEGTFLLETCRLMFIVPNIAKTLLNRDSAHPLLCGILD